MKLNAHAANAVNAANAVILFKSLQFTCVAANATDTTNAAILQKINVIHVRSLKALGIVFPSMRFPFLTNTGLC